MSELSVDLEASPAQQLCQLRAIYHGVPVGLAFLGSDLRYVSLNQRLADLNGMPIHAHLGRKVCDVVPAIYAQFEPYLLSALDGHSVHGVEVSVPGGERNPPARTLMVSYEPTRDEAGEVIGVCVSVSDISQVKQKEEALRESDDHHRHVVELNPQTPWVMGSWRDHDGSTSSPEKGRRQRHLDEPECSADSVWGRDISGRRPRSPGARDRTIERQQHQCREARSVNGLWNWPALGVVDRGRTNTGDR